MDNKNLSIVATIVTVLFCGIPGLASLCLGVLVTFQGSMFANPRSDTLFSLSLLCIGVIFIAIPVVTGLLTFRKRPPKETNISPDEPIPPPS